MLIANFALLCRFLSLRFRLDFFFLFPLVNVGLEGPGKRHPVGGRIVSSALGHFVLEEH